MKTYENLTDRAKVRRLRSIARHALDQFGLEVVDLRLMGMFTNTLFRLRTASGETYVLRICRPGWRTDTDLQSEAVWLQALDRDTDIGAPRPLPALNGEYIVIAEAAGVPDVRRCTLQSWLPGVLLGKRLTEENLFKMGLLFAKMHAYAANFAPPPGFTSRKLDRLFARGEEDSLFSPACLEALPDRHRLMIESTRRKVLAVFERLYAHPEGLRLIHNDLWHGNIKIDHGRLRPFDFEDTIWGYPVQDIAMAFQDLMNDVSSEQFASLRAAFRRGYESRSAWPESEEGQIYAFQAGRMLWVANYVARFERPYLEEHIARVAPLLERFLETGRLRK